jgi:predicted GIY-YIG superfamily endonuclease
MTTLPPYAKNGNNPQTYTVYALIDPRDQAIRYVGISYDVYQRMRQHSRCEGNNAAKNAWIQELQREQLMFIMRALEKVETLEAALEREQAWIKHLLRQGVKLTNIAGRGERTIEGKLVLAETEASKITTEPCLLLEGYRLQAEQKLEVAIGGHWIEGHVRLIEFPSQHTWEDGTTRKSVVVAWSLTTGIETDPLIRLYPGILARMQVYGEEE